MKEKLRLKKSRPIWIFLCVVFILTLCGCNNDSSAIKIHDKNCYINEDYFNEEKFDNAYLIKGGKNASQFFPEYSDIDFNYKSVDFYIHCYSVDYTFFSYPDSLFILEFTFENRADYTVLIDKINARFSFLEAPIKADFGYIMPASQFELGDYNCKVVKQEAKNLRHIYPDSVQIICTNENCLTIRYLYCYEEDQDIIDEKEFINSIERASDCDW